MWGEHHKPWSYSWKLLHPFISSLFLWRIFFGTFTLCYTLNVGNQINLISAIWKIVLSQLQIFFFTDSSVTVLTELQNGRLGSHRLMSQNGRGFSPEAPDHLGVPPKHPSNSRLYDGYKIGMCFCILDEDCRVMSVIICVLIFGYRWTEWHTEKLCGLDRRCSEMLHNAEW